METPTSGQHAAEPPRAAGESMSGGTASPGSMPPAQQRTWDETKTQIDTYADRAREVLPAAPPGLLNGYMSFAPWVAIVFGVLGILISLVALVGSSILGPVLIMFGSPGTGFTLIVGSGIALISSVLELVGGWLMLQRKATGWWLLGFGLVVSFLSSLVHATVLSLIIILLIAYVHLQVKPNYR
ncbi:MAG TPA: hypothetical protein VKV73_05445 [Chloroflexota bacterium]|nr:hypothetical protein [Chloroflexota bacterium]